ncbi:hypothetical protein LguiA_009981 [Lonicera macranthoides]
MATKYSSSKTSLFVALIMFMMVVSPTLMLQSEAATGLTAREVYQKPSHPPCLCCQKTPPPPGCYCACYVTTSQNGSP